MRPLKIYQIAVLLLIGFSVASFSVHSQDETSIEKQQAVNATESARDQLVDVKNSITSVKTDLVNIDARLKLAKDDVEKNSLLKKKEKLLGRLEDLTFSFEEITTGGVKLSDFDKKDEQTAFDLEAELLEIFKPMISELKDLTEEKREIERLKSEKLSLEKEMPVIEGALKKIEALKAITKDVATLKNVSLIEEEWKKRQTSNLNQLQLVSFQLDEKLNPPDAKSRSVSENLYLFFTGRGLTIILALLAFSITFVVFAWIGNIVKEAISHNPEHKKQFFQRAMHLVIRIFTILISVFVTMVVLYIRDDWLILGLILLILIGAIWALRTSLPNFVREAKLLLNIGPVREGERVTYNGIPWNVTVLNIYSTLTNPALDGGEIKLPVDVIVGLCSRPSGKEEGWFPTEKGDYVYLDDGIFGPVIEQTPDMVQMAVLGGSTKTYNTGDFLGLNPRNLSHGFGVFVTFGLDYNLQDNITKTIPTELEGELKQRMASERFSSSMKTLEVLFKQASGSSLDLLIVSIFKGDAAGDYFAIGRAIQRHTVDICTERSWNIPFDNVTVHLEKPEGA